MKLIAIIYNYDKDENARQIRDALPCETYIVDSSGIVKEGFIATDEPFFSGCFNKAMEIFLYSDATHCLSICSDIIGNWLAVVQKILVMPADIGVWMPAVYGSGWRHIKPVGQGLRDIPFAEGMINCMTREVVKEEHYINCDTNRHAYGVDIYLSYAARQKGLRVVADDSVRVYHPFGKAYSNREGERQMLPYVAGKGAAFKAFCRSLGVGISFYTRYYRRLRGIVKKANNRYSYK